jgi:hypothetical protein
LLRIPCDKLGFDYMQRTGLGDLDRIFASADGPCRDTYLTCSQAIFSCDAEWGRYETSARVAHCALHEVLDLCVVKAKGHFATSV